MPTPSHHPWNLLFANLPCGDHRVMVSADFWRKPFTKTHLSPLFDDIFHAASELRISRDRLLRHAYRTPEQKCAEILMWGYPSGGRNNLHTKYLSQLPRIATLSSMAAPWMEYYHSLKAVGLGISTISKLAYFHGLKFGAFQALILDLRIMSTLANKRWSPLKMPSLTYSNAHRLYPEYLERMANQAASIPCDPDQLELGLFLFGNSF